MLLRIYSLTHSLTHLENVKTVAEHTCNVIFLIASLLCETSLLQVNYMTLSFVSYSPCEMSIVKEDVKSSSLCQDDRQSLQKVEMEHE